MIKKIEKISKLGVFDNYQWKCSNEFNRYNICFGFNGSGKSTLSNFFNLIAYFGDVDPRFGDVDPLRRKWFKEQKV